MKTIRFTLPAAVLHRAARTQLKASPNTVTSYRDTFRLLLKYAADRLRRRRLSCRWPISTPN